MRWIFAPTTTMAIISRVPSTIATSVIDHRHRRELTMINSVMARLIYLRRQLLNIIIIEVVGGGGVVVVNFVMELVFFVNFFVGPRSGSS